MTILAAHFKALKLEFDAIYAGRQVRHDQTLAAYLAKFSNPENEVPPIRKTEVFNVYLRRADFRMCSEILKPFRGKYPAIDLADHEYIDYPFKIKRQPSDAVRV